MHSLKLSPPIGRGPFVVQNPFLTVSVVSSLKNPTFVLLLELWWEQQKIRVMQGNFPLLFCFSWVLGLALNLSSVWYYFCVWYERVISNLFSLWVIRLPRTIHGRNCSFSVVWSLSLCQNQLAMNVCLHIWTFYSVPLSASILSILFLSIK